jgi:hypothetical protein
MAARRFLIRPRSELRGHVPMHYGRQQFQTLRTPRVLELEQLRLREKTIDGMILSSFLSGNGMRRPLPESCKEELHPACMTAMISGPRYGSTVGTSLVISANCSVLATRPDLAYQGNNTWPGGLFPGRDKKLHIP